MADRQGAQRMLTPQQAEQHARETMQTLLTTPQFRGLQLPNEGRDVIDSVSRAARARGSMSAGAVESRVLSQMRGMLAGSEQHVAPMTITAAEAMEQGPADLQAQGAANIAAQMQQTRQQLRILRQRLEPLERATAEARTAWLAEKSMGVLNIARGFVAPLGGTVGEEQGKILVQGADMLSGEYREAHGRASAAMIGMMNAWGAAMSAVNEFERAGESGDPARILAASTRVEGALRQLEPAVRTFRSAAEPLTRMNSEFAEAFKSNVAFVYETAVVVGTAGLAGAVGHRLTHSLTHGAERMLGVMGEEAGANLLAQGARGATEFSVGVAEKAGHHYVVAKAAHEGELLAEHSAEGTHDAPPIEHAID